VTFDADDALMLLTPTAHLRFVVREVTAFDINKNGYSPTNIKILQQWFEPHQRYAGIVPGEWRDVQTEVEENEDEA
jgi:hypothetical protein